MFGYRTNTASGISGTPERSAIVRLFWEIKSSTSESFWGVSSFFFVVFEDDENEDQDEDVSVDAGEEKIFVDADEASTLVGLADCRVAAYTGKKCCLYGVR